MVCLIINDRCYILKNINYGDYQLKANIKEPKILVDHKLINMIHYGLEVKMI